jgi:hypothetical protein
MWTVHVVRKFDTQDEAEAFVDSMMDTEDSPQKCQIEIEEDDANETQH